MSDYTTAASALASVIAAEQKQFAREANDAAELMEQIAKDPTSSRISSDLSRLSQQVAQLIRRAAKIDASQEAAQLMGADHNTEK